MNDYQYISNNVLLEPGDYECYGLNDPIEASRLVDRLRPGQRLHVYVPGQCTRTIERKVGGNKLELYVGSEFFETTTRRGAILFISEELCHV